LRALAPLGDDPRRPDANVKKLAGYEDRYRLRVGDYRVIYEITDKRLVILAVGAASDTTPWIATTPHSMTAYLGNGASWAPSRPLRPQIRPTDQ
jgi:ParE toxin of type II toxin-antitoxin system, parDE